MLAALPEALRERSGMRALRAHPEFPDTARDTPPAKTLEQLIAADPGNLDARYRLAAVRRAADDYDTAPAQLLEITHREPGFRDAAARNGLFAIFTLLGEQDAWVQRVRAELQKTVS